MIDGTVIDTRHTQLYLLRQFDLICAEQYGGALFVDKAIEDIVCYERFMPDLLAYWGVADSVIKDFMGFYQLHRWREEVLMESEWPYPGVIELVELLAGQQAVVALNTGRCESMRAGTLGSLRRFSPNAFSCEWLKMNGHGWVNVHKAKRQALVDIEYQGAKVVAMIDNEPSNLNILSDYGEDLLLLHADTIYGHSEPLHSRCVSGSEYDLSVIEQWQEVVA